LEREKTRAQTEPKSSPPDAFPGLQSSKYAKIRRAREERGKGRVGDSCAPSFSNSWIRPC